MIAIACVDRVQRAREARVYGARLLGLPKIEKKIKNDSQPYRDGASYRAPARRRAAREALVP